MQLKSVGRLGLLARITVSLRRKMAHSTGTAFVMMIVYRNTIRFIRDHLISDEVEEDIHQLPRSYAPTMSHQIEFCTKTWDDVGKSVINWLHVYR